MLLAHIIDDFVLQPICLSKLKQKEIWKKYNKETNNLYENDYKVALFIHGLSWSILVHLPIIFYFGLYNSVVVFFSVLFHAIIHSVVDDYKANKKRISLIYDQYAHFGQICIVFCLFLNLNSFIV